MNILYVDESGDDGFSPNNKYNNGETPTKYFIRSGLIIHDRKWKKINEKIDALKFSKKIPKNIELHATEILNGRKKIYDKKTKKRKSKPNWFGINYPNRRDRFQLLIDICKLINNLDLCIIIIVIDKTKVNKSANNYKKIPKEKSWEFMIERYNLYLKNSEDYIGAIISDAIETNIEEEHREFAKAIYSSSMHVEEFHFIESILFEPSDSSNLLQLIDIASFAFQRYFNLQDDRLFKIIKTKLFSNDNKVDGCGLKIWPE